MVREANLEYFHDKLYQVDREVLEVTEKQLRYGGDLRKEVERYVAPCPQGREKREARGMQSASAVDSGAGKFGLLVPHGRMVMKENKSLNPIKQESWGSLNM
ncbi:hypothetical protein B0A50_04902 [Salinomyces thailandicus]|uniref:Uncharacterized protein n=1 Tax=Salinomyces thailandicus TaxID=706561 RepID=A0A4U0TZ02_9PEZI|nr:hypothetical protein B0A50_04902 [Salinomyces thailandica]